MHQSPASSVSSRRCYSLLQDILSELTTSFSENLRLLSRRACELSGSPAALYFRRDVSAGECYVASGYNIEERIIGSHLPKDGNVRELERMAVRFTGMPYSMSLPVLFKGEEIGRLIMLSSEPHRFTLTQDDALQAILLAFSYCEGRQDAFSVMLYQGRLKHALLSISQYLSKEKDASALLGAVCRELVDKQGAYNAWIGLVGEDGLSDGRSFQAGFSEAQFAPMKAMLENGLIPDCAKSTLSMKEIRLISTRSPMCSTCPLSKVRECRHRLIVQLSFGSRKYGWLAVSVPGESMADHIEHAVLDDLAESLGMSLNSIDLERERRDADARRDSMLDRFERLSSLRLHHVKNMAHMSVREILLETTDEAERWTGSMIGFFHFIDEDRGDISIQAWSTRTSQTICHMKEVAGHYLLEHAGIWADAVREKKAVVYNDYQSVPWKNGLPEGHAPIHRIMVVPIIRDGRVKAILGVGNKPEPYDDDDLRWVGAMADQTWDIVENKLYLEQQKTMQAQLEHSSKLEMIGKLSAGITHEVNNPLNFITLNVSSLERDYTDLAGIIGRYRQLVETVEGSGQSGELTGTIRSMEQSLDLDGLLVDLPELLKAMRQGVERITAITRSMRNLSFKSITDARISSDMNRIVRDAVMLAVHESKGIADVRMEPGAVPMIECNPSQIGQVVLNLLLNSLQAIGSQGRSTQGSVVIRVWADLRWLYCEVKDDGPGIDKAIMGDIFTPFVTTKEQGLGTGLGLSISYDIVRKHNGRLTVDCPPEGGTVITMSLPLYADEKTQNS